MNTTIRALSRPVLGLLLASGIAAGALASSAKPAEAGVFVSVGVGGGYAPGYHWHRWHDGYGWHREWVRIGYAAPAYVYGPPVEPVYFYHGPRYHVRPYGWDRYHGWYGHRDHWDRR
jgi:hypothetical protein